MRSTTRGRVVVTRQPDGWWRWRFVPASPDGDELVSAEAYPERDEAVESAQKAYPEHRPQVDTPPPEHHPVRTLVRRAAKAGAVVAVVAAAARSGNRRGGSV
jgi:hypothetical protein